MLSSDTRMRHRALRVTVVVEHVDALLSPKMWGLVVGSEQPHGPDLHAKGVRVRTQ
jgi:hypothetical protein